MNTQICITSLRDQESSGELNKDDEDYISAAEGIIEIPTESIQRFDLIPDYKGSPRSPYPVVLKTPSRCICLDGWSMVEQAKAQGIKSIQCFTYYSEECSDEEVAIRKAAVRIMPHAGAGSYVEIIRNVKMLHAMLLNKDNVFELSHGGTRKGEGFFNNKDDNVRQILALRLGKSVSTIGKYLNHSEFLSDTALSTLLNISEQSRLKPDKEFFEGVQSNKRRLKEMLTSQAADKERLTEEVSRYVLGTYQQYRATGKIVSINKEIEADENEEILDSIHSIQTAGSVSDNSSSVPAQKLQTKGQEEISDTSSIASLPAKEFTPPTFKYTSSSEMATLGVTVSLTRSDIQAELSIITERLSSLATDSDIDFNGITGGIKSIITDLSVVLQKAISIQTVSTDKERG